MFTKFATLVVAAVVSLAVSPVAHAADADPLVHTSYHDPTLGPLGDWSKLTRSTSTAAQFAAADVWVYGDSIMVADHLDLAARLAPLGLQSAVDAQAGHPTAPAVARLSQRVASVGHAPQILVMAIGTNDVFNPTFMAAATSAARAAVGARTRIVWVNVWVKRRFWTVAWAQAAATNVAAVNRAIAEAPVQRVVDWHGYLSRDRYLPLMYLSDGVHTNLRGQRIRNILIVNAVVAVRG